jgi:hypothetical protein
MLKNDEARSIEFVLASAIARELYSRSHSTSKISTQLNIYLRVTARLKVVTAIILGLLLPD